MHAGRPEPQQVGRPEPGVLDYCSGRPEPQTPSLDVQNLEVLDGQWGGVLDVQCEVLDVQSKVLDVQ